MVNGGFAISTCCTTRARCPLRRRRPPQHGQTWSRCSSKWLTCSGGNGMRSCLAWPGWPPTRRGLEELSAGGGLTMSEEGGLDEVEELFLAAANCSRNWVTSASKASTRTCKVSTCACKRLHCRHGCLTGLAMILQDSNRQL